MKCTLKSCRAYFAHFDEIQLQNCQAGHHVTYLTLNARNCKIGSGAEITDQRHLAVCTKYQSAE